MTPVGLARYQQVDVLTMSPAQRVLLLYNHLLVNLRQAKAALAARDIAGRSTRVAKALDVLNELVFSLDRENGGALAERLAAIYVYLLGEITRADREQDAARLDRVIELCASLQEAWAEVAKQTVTA
jgi:flagellar secretion chaperone FliS